MVDRAPTSWNAFNRIHPKSFEWLENDSSAGQGTQRSPSRRFSHLRSCLGQWVIDTMVGMDKDSSSATIVSNPYCAQWKKRTFRRRLIPWPLIPQIQIQILHQSLMMRWFQLQQALPVQKMGSAVLEYVHYYLQIYLVHHVHNFSFELHRYIAYNS